ncbi:UbiA family prenyltransferase [Streptomyces sp. NPDC058770]|uniref:UbiA family prenyltransferase n=1 Tax=Streptomyces sp. NPDC058770 TaxID=3346631 RepID=UPI0036876B7A
MSARAWAELLRVSALFTVPGDALAGAAATGRSPGRGTALAVGASLCLYEAGMALNDWADREEDAVDRPHRPLPSGRVAPGAALAAAGALTAAGLGLAARAGRPALVVATGLAATVWAYDLRLKHTPAGPAAMAAARALDLLLGAAATATATPGTTEQRRRSAGTGTGARAGSRPCSGPNADSGAVTSGPAAPRSGGFVRGGGSVRAGGRAGAGGPVRAGDFAQAGGFVRVGGFARAGGPVRAGGSVRVGGFTGVGGSVRAALPAAGLLGVHTYAVTAVSRHEARGGSTAVPLAALATTAALGATILRERCDPCEQPGAVVPVPRAGRATNPLPFTARGPAQRQRPHRPSPPPAPATRLLLTALTGAYLRTATGPLLHAALNPSPPLTQRAVGAGIRAAIPLQAALAVRAGATGTGMAVMGLVPLARALARKVNPT